MKEALIKINTKLTLNDKNFFRGSKDAIDFLLIIKIFESLNLFDYP